HRYGLKLLGDHRHRPPAVDRGTKLFIDLVVEPRVLLAAWWSAVAGGDDEADVARPRPERACGAYVIMGSGHGVRAQLTQGRAVLSGREGASMTPCFSASPTGLALLSFKLRWKPGS